MYRGSVEEISPYNPFSARKARRSWGKQEKGVGFIYMIWPESELLCGNMMDIDAESSHL